MANIKKVLRGYICDEREKNWTKEYAKREIERHKNSSVMDHPDESVTTKKLAQGCVTKEKLDSEISELIEHNKDDVTSLAIQLHNEIKDRKIADNLKADKPTTLSGYGITDVYTKGETDSQIGAAIESTSIYKADRDLSNVPNEYFLAKLNSVLPNGDEVSY